MRVYWLGLVGGSLRACRALFDDRVQVAGCALFEQHGPSRSRYGNRPEKTEGGAPAARMSGVMAA